jgi:phage terminase large subunit
MTAQGTIMNHLIAKKTMTGWKVTLIMEEQFNDLKKSELTRIIKERGYTIRTHKKCGKSPYEEIVADK